MSIRRLSLIVALLGALGLSGCGGCEVAPPGSGDGSAGDASGIDAVGVDGGSTDGLVLDATGTDTAPGQDRLVDVPDPNRPDNDSRDSDCDGLSDLEEYGAVYGGGLQTDPGDPDSDGDGVDDGTEVGRTASPDSRCTMFAGDADPTSHTDPTRADSDGDGLDDGAEDLDGDGARDPVQELDPRNPDSDGDGYCDGPNDVAGVCVGGDPDPFSTVDDRDRDGVPDDEDSAPDNPDLDGDGLCDGPRDVPGTCEGGEDLNGDGQLGAGETDPTSPDSDCDGVSDAEELQLGLNPRKADSDGDLIPDGVELGRTQNLDTTNCSAFTADADPTTTTDPLDIDSDDDGIHDGIEDADRDGEQDADETDPEDVDSDGDGLCDGVAQVVAGTCTGGEDTNTNGRVDPGETDPRTAGSTGPDADADGLPDALEDLGCTETSNPDSDGDGLCDGHLPVPGTCEAGEDLNASGRVEVGESDPCSIDSDCDGLVDGDGYGDYLGEDDLGTSADNPDSDGDGLLDGLEAGVAGAAVPTGTTAGCGFTADADSSTTTNPTLADHDSDGVLDGAEDTNQNGAVDDGELDPNDGGDATAPVLAACSIANLVPVDPRIASTPDQQLVVAQRGGLRFGEQGMVTLPSQNDAVIGQVGFDSTSSVAYLALTLTPAGADALAEEAAGQALLDGLGNITTPITYSFTSWDGYPAVHATYLMAGNVGVKARVNAIVSAYAPGAAGLLDTAGDVSASGGFKVSAEFMRRSDLTAVVLVALVPAQHSSGEALFHLSDLSDGSAMGQAGDAIGVQCERFEGQGYAPIDILWAVDNSISMNDEQAAVASSADALEARLNRATVDWRIAEVSSAFYDPPNTGQGCTALTCGNTLKQQCRQFTTDINEFKGWFTSSDASWIGAGGTCNLPKEEIIRGAQLILTPAASNGGLASYMPSQASADAMHLRENVNLVLILLADADDQFYSNTTAAAGIDTYEAFFRGLPVASVTMGGILCPDGSCGEAQRTPHVATGLVNRFGGVLGQLKDLNSIAPTVDAIIDDVTGGVSPYVLSKDAISSTVKVSMDHDSTVGTCNWDDLPRDRNHGFDYDSRNRSIVFFGDCRPRAISPAPEIAVSYRYWIDRTPDADPPAGCECTPPQVCYSATQACYCPSDCGVGNLPAERVCNTATCTVECRPDCGASCPGASVCNPSLGVCACECPGDCGGASPGGGFVCDRDAGNASFCSYICSGCVGSPPNGDMVCDTASCSWQCPACSDCPGLATCNDSSCACECNQTLSCNPGFAWEAEACDCVCDTGSLGCGDAYLPDPGLCACVCADDCGGTCEGNLICNESLCACLPMGG